MFYNLLKLIYGIVPKSPELIAAQNYNPRSYHPHYVTNIKRKNVDNMSSNELHEEVEKILEKMLESTDFDMDKYMIDVKCKVLMPTRKKV